MSIREIPKSYEYQCDGCPVTHLQENANGHYFNSTPEGWMTVKLQPGHGGGGGTEKLLCPNCKMNVRVPGFTSPQRG